MNKPVSASFRDPDGFLYFKGGKLYRQVNYSSQENYTKLIDSGLYQRLVRESLLIPHEEVTGDPSAFKTIQPAFVPFISYPYEWSFSQLKDAALATLSIQNIALEYGMSLKDASAYNIQFLDGKPVLIDTLSFEVYQEGYPWVAYRQFCQHFLAPLALMAYKDIRLSKLSQVFIDGIPLDLASRLLPMQTKINPSFSMHIHLHASMQARYADQTSPGKIGQGKVSKTGLLGLISNLKSSIHSLRWNPGTTAWNQYYDATNYSDADFEEKKQIIGKYLDIAKPVTLWDLGANTGLFSRIASDRGVRTVAFDYDAGAVEYAYLDLKKTPSPCLLPLIMDLTNPSPDLGWDHQERNSLLSRGPADAVMALALIHHLAISNNVPFEMLAKFFAECGRWLIIEFVPKSDSQVKKLLATRKDIFDHYTPDDFEACFGRYYRILEKTQVGDSERTLYLMEQLPSVLS